MNGFEMLILCYLIAKRIDKSGCIAKQTELDEEMANFAYAKQETLGHGVQS